MRRSAEKSAVRWISVILSVLFFFIAASAWTLRHMQQTYGGAGGETERLETLADNLYDEFVNSLKKDLRTYFDTGGTIVPEVQPQYQSANTNFRFIVRDSEGKVILPSPVAAEKDTRAAGQWDESAKTTGAQAQADLAQQAVDAQQERLFAQTKTTSIRYLSTADRKMRTVDVTIDCWVCSPFQTDDLFSRAQSIAAFGAALEDVLWSVFVFCSFAAFVFFVLCVRGAFREAKRYKGAGRLFNALPPDLYAVCVLPAAMFIGKFLLKIQDREVIVSYLRTGSGEYRFLLRSICLTALYAMALVLLMLLIYSLRRGGLRNVFALRRFVHTPFPRRMLVYLVVMQIIKTLAIALYLTDDTQWVVLFLLLEKLVTLPVVYRILRQLRAVMDKTEQFVQGDLSGRASCEGDYETLRMHGADVDSIVQRISESADAYVKSSKFKAELITNLSHDIKTPLTSIISYTQLLERDDLTDEDRAKYLQVLQRHSARLQKLVEDLSEVSDAASGNVPVQLTDLDLCALVQQSAAGFEERLQSQDVTIAYQMPSEPVYVRADPRLLQRVVDNLMNNICKYTRAGTEVQIVVSDGESEVAAVFRNRAARPLKLSGEALMERFVREDSSRHTDGSGLGLSIAQSLMQLQDGTLRLHTEDDEFTSQILFRKS